MGSGGVADDHAFACADDIAQEGVGAREPGDRRLAQHDLDPIAGGVTLRPNEIVFARRQDQEAAIRAGILQRDRHQPLDQLGQFDLAGQRLRGFDDARDIELLDRAKGRRGTLRNGKMRIEVIELPHFSVGAPAEITGPRVAQICVCESLEAAGHVEAGGRLIGQALVLREIAVARRSNRLFIQPLCVEFSALDAGYFRRNQRMLVGERRRTVFGPLSQLFLVPRQEFSPSVLLVSCRARIERRHRQRGIVRILEELYPDGRGPKHRLRLVGRGERLGIVARQETHP